jgi:hypothetical protein
MTGFLDFVHRPIFDNTREYNVRELDLFPSSGEGGDTYRVENTMSGDWICFRPLVRAETPTLFGLLEKANFCN